MTRIRKPRPTTTRPPVRPQLETLEERLAPSVTPDHVVLVIEENHGYSEIIGSSPAPYINSLAAQGALMTNSFAITHPSEPNYLDLFSGSNQGITDDSCPVGPFSTPNLGRGLINAGRTFGGYSEDLPYVGDTECYVNGYDRDHNPWVDFSNVQTSANMPFQGYFPSDFSTLPTVSIVVPNLTHDMHDGTIRQGDTWLQSNIDSYLQWAQTNNSLLIVTWDEDDGSRNNRVATLFLGPMVNPGQYGETINHFNLLRTIEDMYGVAYAGQSANVAPITDIWRTTDSPPAAPSNLTASAASAREIDLSWTDNSASPTVATVRGTTNLSCSR